MGCHGERDVTGVVATLAGMGGSLPLQVTATDVFQTTIGGGSSGTVTSNPTLRPNTTVTGGVSPYTYSWVRLSGDTPTINSATLQNPTWQAVVDDGFTNLSAWQVTVTDAASQTAQTSINVELSYIQL